jgi:hypothetical protein
MRVELGRALPFSSVVAANDHGISDADRGDVARRYGVDAGQGLDRGRTWRGGAAAVFSPELSGRGLVGGLLSSVARWRLIF